MVSVCWAIPSIIFRTGFPHRVRFPRPTAVQSSLVHDLYLTGWKIGVKPIAINSIRGKTRRKGVQVDRLDLVRPV
jgi:hypothetical protein